MNILSATGNLILPFSVQNQFVENQFLSVSKMFITNHKKKIVYAYHMMSMIH